MTDYTPIPTDIINNENLNAQQFHTFCQIMSHCWKPETGSFDWIEPTSMSMLAKVFNKPRTTLLRHIGELEEQEVIKIHRLSEIAFTLIPTATVHEWTGVSTSGPTTIKTLSIKKDSLSELKKEDVHQRTPVHQPTVDVEIVAILKEAGVGDPMRTRIATSGKAFSYVNAWLEYSARKNEPVGYALAAIRDELPKPEYCDLCGGTDGKHGLVQTELCGQVFCPNENYKVGDAELLGEYGAIEPIRT